MDKNIEFIQLRYKFISYLKKKKYQMNKDIMDHITKIMNNVNKSFENKIISNFTYTNVNNHLSNILSDYSFPIKGIHELNKVKDKLKDITFQVGTDKVLDIIEFYYNYSINNYEKKIKDKVIFLNKYFNVTKVYQHKKDTTLPIEYDLNEISNLISISYSKIKKTKQTLLESINGALIYLKVNKTILIVSGYFVKDNLNIIKSTQKFKNNISLNTVDNTFKNNYIVQLSLRDYFIYSFEEIIEKINSDYNKIKNYQKNNISFIVKDFLNKQLVEQLEIIKLLIITNKEEYKYTAYLLYDLINNDSYLLKSQPNSDQIFNNLHWSIQKNFRDNLNKYEEKNKNISFNIEDISYEKRIYLMKCSEYIKQKAIEKYKEITKSNDNTAKSQHYLDSILKIPFNIFKKEEILYLKDTFETKIINNIIFINEFINKNEVNSDLLDEKSCLCYIEMLEYISKFKQFNSIFFNNKVLNSWGKKNKNKDIIYLINTINSQNKSLKLKNKGSKKILLETLNDFFNDLSIPDKIKLKYYEKINLNKIEPIHIKTSKLIKEWDEFKIKRVNYINNVENILNTAIYSQEDAKLEIKRIIGQWINGKMTGYCLGFEGPPGIGKTSLAKKGISKCLVDKNGDSRPFSFIALGGSSNGSLLEGHNYTYVGSNYGKIIEILIKTKCMNPIIYIDELDKISNTENGKEIIGILTHLTDPSQNDHFNDKYFSGIDFDLSKVLFIFSYNDFSKIDPILADRIHRIKFNYLQKHEKIHIVKNYILPELLTNIGYKKSSIVFSDAVIDYIITNYTYEAGIRKLKEKVFEIIREINLDNILKDADEKPVIVTLDYVKKIFMKKPQVYIKKIDGFNSIGVVNGLYATSMGLGGIIPIQVIKTFANSKMDFTITGQQGEVMKESIYCAKSVAYNILPDDIKKKITDDSNFGIHLHCPEASTPKDGPSAGGALTLAVVSLFTGINVKNTIGLTGEIDIKGNITKIGGLDLKIDGGKYAGLETIIVPTENKNDYKLIEKNNPHILEDIEIIFVSHIKEIIELALENNTLEFNFDL